MDCHRSRLVQLHGADPIAYSTLQTDMHFFETSYGFIAYRTVSGMDITLGPPVCASEDIKTMLAQFLSRSRRPVFSYITQDTLTALKDTGLYCSGMGVDRYVDVGTFVQSPGKTVLGALKKSHKVNFTLQALNFRDCTSAQIERMETISKNYLKNAQCSFELSFINRPMQYQDDEMKRVFALCKYDGEHNGIFGYAVLNPYFKAGKVEGYLLDILRFEPTRLWGVWLSSVWQVARLLAVEGHGLALGFCPLYSLHNPSIGSSPWLNWQTRCAARLLGNVQYVRRLTELKSHIPGWQEPRYFASHSRNLLKIFLTFLNASGMNTRQLFGPELVRSVLAGVTPKMRQA